MRSELADRKSSGTENSFPQTGIPPRPCDSLGRFRSIRRGQDPRRNDRTSNNGRTRGVVARSFSSLNDADGEKRSHKERSDTVGAGGPVSSRFLPSESDPILQRKRAISPLPARDRELIDRGHLFGTTALSRGLSLARSGRYAITIGVKGQYLRHISSRSSLTRTKCRGET